MSFGYVQNEQQSSTMIQSLKLSKRFFHIMHFPMNSSCWPILGMKKIECGRELFLSQIQWLRNLASQGKITGIFTICLQFHKIILLFCLLEFFSVIGRKEKECKEWKYLVFSDLCGCIHGGSTCVVRSSIQWVAKTRKTDHTPYTTGNSFSIWKISRTNVRPRASGCS